MRVGIVGAGISGLAAARSLKAGGYQPVIFEKNDRLGGRVTTRTIGDYVFDPGASAISPRGHAIEKVLLEELDQTYLVKIEKPYFLHQGMRPVVPDHVKSQAARYTYTVGNSRLSELLANGLDVRFKTQIENIEKNGKGYRLAGESFDAVILTPPIPQTSTLLWSLGESRPFANCRYRACLSIMLGFAKELPDVHYSALLDPDQRHPLVWLSLESVKSPDRAPAGHSALVIQMSPTYSLTNFSAPDNRIVDDSLDYLAWLYGKDWQQPEISAVKRWKYSQPESVALFETVNDPGTRLVISGDGVVAGRTENAYDSGLKAASLLLAQGAVEAAG